LAYLHALLEKAKAEITRDRYMSAETRGKIFCEFGFWDCWFALQCSYAGAPAAKGEFAGAVDDKEAEKRSAAVLAVIEHQLETISIFKGYAEARSFSLPPADATDKLLRYEAHLDRQLYRAMDQLERLQRQRKGEKVPPQTWRGGIRLFTKQSQELSCSQHWLCLASGVAQEQQNGKTNYQTKPTRLLFSTILLE